MEDGIGISSWGHKVLRRKEAVNRRLDAGEKGKMELTLERLLRHPSFMNMNTGVSTISNWISDPLSRMIFGAHTQDPKQNDGSNTVTSSFGYELGKIADMNFFPTSRFTDPQLDFIDHADIVNKRVHKNDYRDMGGPYEAHVIDMLKIYFKIAGSLGVPLDHRLVASVIMHDLKEDFGPIKGLSRQYKILRKEAHEKGIDTEIEMGRLREQIRAGRAKLGYELRQGQLESITAIGDKYKLSPGEIAALGVDGAVTLSVVDWLTRHTEARYFFQSMYLLHQMHDFKFYSNKSTGEPSQVEAMRALGITRGMEPLDYFLMRVFPKALDRIALSTERKQRFTSAEAREMERLMQQYPTLMETYGKIDFRGKEMPRPYNLNILYRNFIDLQNIALALRRIKNIEQNRAAYENLQLVKEARGYLLDENGKILDDLEASYERDLGKKDSRKARDKVEADAKAFPASLDRITGEGPISRGTRLDTVYQDRWAELDADQFEVAQNFRDVLGFQKLQQIFADPARNVIDLPYNGKPTIRLFYIKGLTDSLTQKWQPHP